MQRRAAAAPLPATLPTQAKARVPLPSDTWSPLCWVWNENAALKDLKATQRSRLRTRKPAPGVAREASLKVWCAGMGKGQVFSGKGTLNSMLSVHREAGKGLKKAGRSKDMRESKDTTETCRAEPCGWPSRD